MTDYLDIIAIDERIRELEKQRQSRILTCQSAELQRHLRTTVLDPANVMTNWLEPISTNSLESHISASTQSPMRDVSIVASLLQHPSLNSEQLTEPAVITTGIAPENTGCLYSSTLSLTSAPSLT